VEVKKINNYEIFSHFYLILRLKDFGVILFMISGNYSINKYL